MRVTELEPEELLDLAIRLTLVAFSHGVVEGRKHDLHTPPPDGPQTVGASIHAATARIMAAADKTPHNRRTRMAQDKRP